MLTPREKIPSTGKFPQRRIATLWTASPNTTNELIRPGTYILIPVISRVCQAGQSVLLSLWYCGKLIRIIPVVSVDIEYRGFPTRMVYLRHDM